MIEEKLHENISVQQSYKLSLLHPGSIITLDMVTPAGQRGKFRSTFIGYSLNDYILVQWPENVKLGVFSNYIKQGLSVTVRGLIEGHEGTVIAFISKVQQMLHIPSRLLVLNFPTRIDLQNLRSATRIDTEIKAKVKINDEYFIAVISDISFLGCQLIIENKNVSLIIGDSLEVIIESNSQLENIFLDAKVCNIKHYSDAISLGLSYSKMNESDVKSLLEKALFPSVE